MASSLFGSQTNNLMDMLQRFNEFKSQYGNADPQQTVQALLKSGKMTQQQFSQLTQMANQLQNILK